MKSEKDCVKIKLCRDPTSENSDQHEFKMALFHNGKLKDSLLFVQNFKTTLKASVIVRRQCKATLSSNAIARRIVTSV